MLVLSDMGFIRTAHRNSLVLWLLVLSLGLRSLIAPGYMLTTDAESPFGLSIALCGSAVGLAIFNDPHLAHVNIGAEQPNHEATSGLLSNTCGLWSTSATYVHFITIDVDHLLQVIHDEFQINYDAPNIRLSHRPQQQPRAPPVSRII